MARLAYNVGLTVAGAAIGSVVPGFGTTLGAFIGSTLAAVTSPFLFPAGEDQQGPRLNDREVSEASYGIPILQVFGTKRIPGQLIWTTGIEEVRNEESQGMSGGKPTTTTFTYRSSENELGIQDWRP